MPVCSFLKYERFLFSLHYNMLASGHIGASDNIVKLGQYVTDKSLTAMTFSSYVYLGKVSGGLASSSPSIAFFIPTSITILYDKRDNSIPNSG